jgi:glutathione S-transferase
MKFIYAKGACSLSVHILLEELNVPYEAIKVSLQDKTVLESYNSRSYVPALILADGTRMTEAVSILQYIAESHGCAFFPKEPLKKAKCIEWLTFTSSELHKGVGPLFHKDDLTEKYLQSVMEKIDKRLTDLDEAVEGKEFIMDEYTIADMYALAILRITEHVGIQLENYNNLIRYKKNLEGKPVIKRVLEMEEKARVEDRPQSFGRPPEIAKEGRSQSLS